ncbi:hypothetical protein ACE3MZ_13035 [Paenibacillus sp. WLX1005]|uniref:hypothetical protein n=1 Tax=Paenibacillus sp. WLX1005 TaxID=3243766 RepID=UPI00398436CB
MISLSLDHRLDEIYDANTKEYFAEVVKTYNAESYRSTIVLLYSVLICDLLYKLTELRERHQDENAQRILNEVATKRKANLTTSSDWEKKYLVDEMSKTELLEISDKCNIDHLKNHRNLAAHPQLNNNNKLYKPTRADAQAHMYNMFEGVFCKSPILTKKIFNDFITNLAEIKDYKMNDDQLKAFLNARYFSNMRLNIKEYLFQNLWKFIFEKTNKECDDNRQINLQALCIIYAENSVHFSGIIRNNNQKF